MSAEITKEETVGKESEAAQAPKRESPPGFLAPAAGNPCGQCHAPLHFFAAPAPSDPAPPPETAMKNRRAYLLLAALSVMVISAFMEPGLLKMIILLAVAGGLIFDIVYNVWKRRKE